MQDIQGYIRTHRTWGTESLKPTRLAAQGRQRKNPEQKTERNEQGWLPVDCSGGETGQTRAARQCGLTETEETGYYGMYRSSHCPSTVFHLSVGPFLFFFVVFVL